MKRIFLTILIIFMTASISLAMPGYNPETDSKPKVYSTEYNDKLFKKLNDEFDKKYPATLTYDKDGYPVYTVNYPPDAYHKEVTCPYYEQYQNEYVYTD